MEYYITADNPKTLVDLGMCFMLMSTYVLMSDNWDHFLKPTKGKYRLMWTCNSFVIKVFMIVTDPERLKISDFIFILMHWQEGEGASI